MAGDFAFTFSAIATVKRSIWTPRVWVCFFVLRIRPGGAGAPRFGFVFSFANPCQGAVTSASGCAVVLPTGQCVQLGSFFRFENPPRRRGRSAIWVRFFIRESMPGAPVTSASGCAVVLHTGQCAQLGSFFRLGVRRGGAGAPRLGFVFSFANPCQERRHRASGCAVVLPTGQCAQLGSFFRF